MKRCRLVLAALFVMAVAPALVQAQIELVQRSLVDPRGLNFANGPQTRFSTAINGATHQQNPLVSYKGYQYVTYYNAQRYVCLGRRKLPNGRWNVIRFKDYRITNNDSHNTAVLGICPKDGTIHLAFDHHSTRLNYRRSVKGLANKPDEMKWNASMFSPITNKLGRVEKNLNKICYPRFLTTPTGDLLLYYRYLTSANGDGTLQFYDGDRRQWRTDYGRFIARDIDRFRHQGKISEFRCPYINGMSFQGNRLHVTWSWRDRFEKSNPRNNHSLCYAYSDDLGKTCLLYTSDAADD